MAMLPEIDVQGILLERLYNAVAELSGILRELPAPQVSVDAPDLTQVVNAVTGLRPSATAEEIGAAVARALGPAPAPNEQADQTMAKVAGILEQLEYRMRAPGQVVGGGVLNLPPNLQANNRLKVSEEYSLTIPQMTMNVAIPAGNTVTGDFVSVVDVVALTVATSVDQLIEGYIDWSIDGTNVNHSNTTPFIGGGAFSVPVQARFARVRVTNLSSSTANFKLEIFGTYHAPGNFLFPIAAPIDPSFEATLTKSLITGAGPDGTFANVGISGTKTLSPTPTVLAANATYTSDWFDCEEYPNVRILVGSDVASAANGIVVSWSDTAAGTVVRSSETYTLRTSDTSNGLFFSTTTRARYMRIAYVNGASDQTRFSLLPRLNTIPLAKNVQIISSSAGQTGQLDVDVVANQIASGALTNRKSLRLKNLSSSARSLFYGFTGGVTVANGDELAAGEAVEMDIDEFVTVYVITTSTAGGGVRCGWTEVA